MGAATVILIKMKKVIRSFREANATSPSTAIIPSEHGIRQSIVFNKLVRNGILIPVNEERYYLNEEREQQVQKRRRSIAFVVVTILLIGIVIMMLMDKR